jgi:curved DNA-binding protein
MSKSLYKTLEVSENASPEDIKKSYKRLARIYHPDINKSKDAEDTFKEINGAYEILGNPNKKRQYDQLGDSMFGNQNFHDFSRNQNTGVDLNDIINEMFGKQSGGFGGAGFGGFGGFGGTGFDVEQLDVNIRIEIPFDISVLGGKQHISANGYKFNVNIPAGIKDGEKLRVKNKGNSASGHTGNMIIKVGVCESPDYTRDDDDLEKIVDISLKVAMFGGKIDIKTPHKELSMKIPKGVRQYQKLRIKELGVTNRKNGKIGDFYVKLNIIIPKIDELDKSLVDNLQNMLPN